MVELFKWCRSLMPRTHNAGGCGFEPLTFHNIAIPRNATESIPQKPTCLKTLRALRIASTSLKIEYATLLVTVRRTGPFLSLLHCNPPPALHQVLINCWKGKNMAFRIVNESVSCPGSSAARREFYFYHQLSNSRVLLRLGPKCS